MEQKELSSSWQEARLSGFGRLEACQCSSEGRARGVWAVLQPYSRQGGSGNEVMDEQEVGVTMEGFKFTKAFLLRG